MRAREGLVLVDGTSVPAAVAALAMHEALFLQDCRKCLGP